MTTTSLSLLRVDSTFIFSYTIFHAPRGTTTLGHAQDALQLLVGGLEVIVHQLVVEEPGLVRARHLPGGVLEALLDGLLLLGPAAAQTLLELLHGGGHHEHEGGRQRARPHRPRPLHVDVQHARLALGGHGLHRREAGAVDVAVHLRVLQELTLRDLLLHLVHLGEVIVHAVLLPWARRASGVAHREAEAVGKVRHQPVDERALAHPGGPAHDNRRRGWLGQILLHRGRSLCHLFLCSAEHFPGSLQVAFPLREETLVRVGLCVCGFFELLEFVGLGLKRLAL
mmetsp:Transcript_36163/g.78916  ORF Transcript_36163/g.78916 Transcript_36163/m.78916 type:complete len:283 (-) Transcript_36163:223-1071(-)